MSRTIPYESAALHEPRGPRPLWVYAAVGAYGLALVGLLVVPLVLARGDNAYPALVATVTVLVACEVALLFVPVRAASRRPVTRGSLWVPLLASAFLAGVLGLGGGLALGEYWITEGEYGWAALASAAAVWLAWTFVFWFLSFAAGPDAIASKLHRWLLAGSVLELLIAVPTHVIVRRRTECCAGLGTGMGICAGVVVMLLAFGPSIGFLYYRRWKQIRRPE